MPKPETIHTSIEAAHAALAAARLPGGLWPAEAGGRQVSVEASCWAVAALAQRADSAPALDAVGALLALQNADGGWPHRAGFPSDIRTANAIIALSATGQPVPPAALTWLIAARCAGGGWGWNGASWNFAEPTALAALALGAAGCAVPAFAAEMAAYFADAQCASGGWNSHSPEALGTAQDATPSVSAWALLALVALGVDPGTIFVGQALRYLKRAAAGVTAPYTAALALRGCVAWGISPGLQAELAEELVKGQSSSGLWKDSILWTAHAMMALTAHMRAASRSRTGAATTSYAR